MVDKPKLDQMLGNLKKYHAELQELADETQESFLADKHRIASAKYSFIIAIECCIDVANHIIASENYRFPKDNADSFMVLIEEAILPKEMANAYRAMAQFRNRLVHLYWDVDNELVYEYLANSLTDLQTFASRIADFVSSQAETDDPTQLQ
jgi:uncharacterized protein YutE (UPF0331/DUF86 family)